MLLAERIAKQIAAKINQKLKDQKPAKHRPLRESKFSSFSSEWSKWSSYVKRHGFTFAQALEFAQAMEDYPALRKNQKECYQIISQVAESFRDDLKHLSSSDLADVLGYTRWILVAEKL